MDSQTAYINYRKCVFITAIILCYVRFRDRETYEGNRFKVHSDIYIIFVFK